MGTKTITMNSNQQQPSIDAQINEISQSFRGIIISAAIEIELLIDVYVTEHFAKSGELNTELYCLILAPRVSAMEKMEVFKYLVNKYSQSFIKSNPINFNEIANLYSERNIFAHYPVDLSDVAKKLFEIDHSITFVRLKNKKENGQVDLVKNIVHNEGTIQSILKRMDSIIAVLRKLAAEIDTEHP